MLPRSVRAVKTLPVGAEGQFEMIVSDDDWLFLRNWRWTFARSHPGGFRELIYARRSVVVADPRFKVQRDGTVITSRFDLFVHHVVLARMGLPAPPVEGWTADHINTRTLDNRRENLRWASPTFQVLNRAGSRNRSPITRGCWRRRWRGWKARTRRVSRRSASRLRDARRGRDLTLETVAVAFHPR